MKLREPRESRLRRLARALAMARVVSYRSLGPGAKESLRTMLSLRDKCEQVIRISGLFLSVSSSVFLDV